MSRKGDWMTTFSGKQFWPLDPSPDEVDIEDIAHALSLICRFGGHCKQFYSVAQHSVIVAQIVRQVELDFVLDALLHDATEAYIGDFIRPLKNCFPMLREIEDKVFKAVAARFGLHVPIPSYVKYIDNVILRNEHAQLIQDGLVWPVDNVGGKDVVIGHMTPADARYEFLRLYETFKR